MNEDEDEETPRDKSFANQPMKFLLLEPRLQPTPSHLRELAL